MEIKDRILEYRIKHRISQRQFAERAGIALQTVSSIERGEQKPQAVTRGKIETVLREREEE